MMHSAPIRLALVATIVALAGCGGGDDEDTAGSPPGTSTTAAQETTSSPAKTTSGGDSDAGGGGGPRDAPADPRTTVHAFLTSSDATDRCLRSVTKDFLFHVYGGPHACIEAPPLAHQLQFTAFRIAGNQATAVVVPSGGPYDGERLTVSLVKHTRGWAVDDLNADVPVGP